MFPRLPKQLIYVLFVLVPFGLIFFNSPFWHNAKLSTMSIGTASVAIVRFPIEEVRKILTYRKTWADLSKLQRETGALKARIVALEEISQENRRYGRLLGFRNRSMFSSEAALVVARDPSSWNSSLMINKGQGDGIRPGMPVVNSSGVIGKVAEVASDVSKVILINDPGFRVAVINQRSRESALLSGSLSGLCRLDYLPQEADVRVGDELVTSSVSASFPEGLLVATVANVLPGQAGEGPHVTATPSVDVARIEEVLVIK